MYITEITIRSQEPISLDSLHLLNSEICSEYLEDGDEITFKTLDENGEPDVWFTYEERPIDQD